MYYKITLNCSKCQKPTDIKLKHNIDGIKKLYFRCILKIHFKIIMGFYEEDRLLSERTKYRKKLLLFIKRL